MTRPNWRPGSGSSFWRKGIYPNSEQDHLPILCPAALPTPTYTNASPSLILHPTLCTGPQGKSWSSSKLCVTLWPPDTQGHAVAAAVHTGSEAQLGMTLHLFYWHKILFFSLFFFLHFFNINNSSEMHWFVLPDKCMCPELSIYPLSCKSLD